MSQNKNEPHMPGAWVCPRCSFTLQKNILSVNQGLLLADDSPLNEHCPNDGQLMRPLTWREVNEDLWKALLEEKAENQRLRDRLSEFETA